MARQAAPRHRETRPGSPSSLPVPTSNLCQMISPAQAARVLGVSYSTIRRMVASGQLRAYRYGDRLIRIDPADLDKARRPVTALTEAA